MIDARSLPEEIAYLDKVIQSFEAQLNEIRQQRELKHALLLQLQNYEQDAIKKVSLAEQRTDVISK